MIVFNHRLTGGIFEGSKIVFNTDLMEQAGKLGYQLPENYHPALLVKTHLLNDFAKYRKSYNWCPDPEAWSMAQRALEYEFTLQLLPDPLSFDEAVRSIELSASPGFPWNKKYQTKRETLANELELIRSIVNRVFEHGDVDYEFLGVRYTNVFWLTSPKSEIRPISKVNDPDPAKRKTRTFMCGDLICHIIGFMLYKTQNDNFLNLAYTNSWSAVGLSPYYGGWHQMANILLRNVSSHSSQFLQEFQCYDASHMEASVSDAVQCSIYAMRNSSLHPRTTRARDWFFLQITNSLIIDVDGFVCMKNGKNPSGNVNTLVDNTLSLILVFLYILARELGDFEKVIAAYRRIACKMVGDDSICEVCPELSRLQLFAWEIGFDLTLESQPGPLTDCSFLSSRFVFDTRYCMWIQFNNYEKIIANVYFNFKAKSWRLCYIKLCAARQMFFAFPEQRKQIDSLLHYILTQHDFDMKMENNKDITYDQARAQFMTDRTNTMLIFGAE